MAVSIRIVSGQIVANDIVKVGGKNSNRTDYMAVRSVPCLLRTIESKRLTVGST